MIRLRPDDDYMIAVHHPTSPAQIGALQLYDRGGASPDQFVADIRSHLAKRLPHTPLLRVRRSAPAHIDCDAWFELSSVDIHTVCEVRCEDQELSIDELHHHVGIWAMEQLDPERVPFHFVVVPRIAGGQSAVYLQTLHALADGVGFQWIVNTLTDGAGDHLGEHPQTPTPQMSSPRTRDERIPSPPEWLCRSTVALLGDAWRSRLHSAELAQARKALADFKADPAHKRARTPKLALSGANSPQRSFTTLSVGLDRFKSIGAALGGTVNDVFLLVGSGAVRSFLLEVGDLPTDPIVVNAARSYRRPEHGEIGNRIVSIHPHLATHLEDPLARLKAIQASMASEVERSKLQEAVMDQNATFFSARKVRQRAAERVSAGGTLTPGNLTLSNVPGPDAERLFAGYPMLANYPTPIVGAGRFLNITMRRYCQRLDLGIMTDAQKVQDARVVRSHVTDALSQLEQLVSV